MASCMTEKRASNTVAALKSKYPNLIAQFCIDNYPVESSTTTTYEYLPGPTEYLEGPVVDCDSVVEAYLKAHKEGIPTSKKVPCPPNTHTRDTFRVKIVDTIVDTRQVDLLTVENISKAAQLVETKDKLSKTKDELHSYQFILGILAFCGLAIALIRYLPKKPF